MSKLSESERAANDDYIERLKQRRLALIERRPAVYEIGQELLAIEFCIQCEEARLKGIVPPIWRFKESDRAK